MKDDVQLATNISAQHRRLLDAIAGDCRPANPSIRALLEMLIADEAERRGLSADGKRRIGTKAAP